MPKTPIPKRDVIARRELCVARASEKVVVEISRPKYVRPSEAVCAYRFIYKGRTNGMDIRGADPFQALQLALNLIPVELRNRKGLPLGKMYLYEPGDDMGFAEVNT